MKLMSLKSNEISVMSHANEKNCKIGTKMIIGGHAHVFGDFLKPGSIIDRLV